MICRDPCVGVARQTAPTKGYQPPLEMLFVVVEIQLVNIKILDKFEDSGSAGVSAGKAEVASRPSTRAHGSAPCSGC